MLHLAVDLHGTLVEDTEEILPELLQPLREALQAVRDRTRLLVCTGNDWSFLERQLPAAILTCFDGAVLEAGCAFADGASQRVIVPDETITLMRQLERELRQRRFPWLRRYAPRQVLVSMFWEPGQPGRSCWQEVHELVDRMGLADRVHVTYSSVAVDLIPRGYSKATGAQALAGEHPVAGLADSMLDLELLTDAAYAMAPANLAPETAEALAAAGRPAVPLEAGTPPRRDVVHVASGPATAGVIEILRYVERWLGHCT